MKRKRLLTFSVCTAFCVAVLASCGNGAKSIDSSAAESEILVTFEDLLAEDDELLSTITDAADTVGMGVAISGNEIFFSCTFSDIEEYDEDSAALLIEETFNSDAIQNSFATLKESLAEASGCDLTIYIDYYDLEGNLLYEGEI